MDQAGQVDHPDDFGQRQQHLGAVAADHPGDQGEHAVGGAAHDQVGELVEGLGQAVEQLDRRRGLVADQVHAHAQGDGEHDDLQDIAFGEGGDRVARHQADQDLHQRGRLLGFAASAGDHVHAFAGGEQGAKQQADAHREGGGDQVDGDGLDADAAELGAVLHRGDAGHQGDEHQRHYEHLDRVEEQRAERRQDQGVLLEGDAGGDAEGQADEDLLP
ncbi:hypothetical protein D3C86_1420350 [compost metagenome]